MKWNKWNEIEHQINLMLNHQICVKPTIQTSFKHNSNFDFGSFKKRRWNQIKKCSKNTILKNKVIFKTFFFIDDKNQ